MNELFATAQLQSEDARPGYRLERLEVLNWGTFHEKVARLVSDGETTLLTGDIGSGKSTLVDAVTTLLLPSQRIAYNKAAGAGSRERSLRSYVLGHYKSERSEASGASRPIGLRDHRYYSVVLGVFRNEGFDHTVTLAQVFWMRDTSQGQPHRMFVSASETLSVADDFAGFGTDLAALRRQLRHRGADVESTFPPYGRSMRRLLGIHSDQAMELFHQTVSMKSVGDLNEFVRRHMLEPADPAQRIDALVAHFDDLSRAHDAVRRAKDQLDALDPLLRHCDRYDELGGRLTAAQAQRGALPVFFAEHRIRLLDAREQQLRATRDDARAEADGHRRRCEGLDAERAELLARRAGAGGDRLAQLEESITRESAVRAQRQRAADDYNSELTVAGLDPVEDASSFVRRRAEVDRLLGDARDDQADAENRRTELLVDRRTLAAEAREVNEELVSLQGRRSSIPRDNLRVRAELATALGVTESDLPLAGELIQVRPEHAGWQGAAERVLRGFALSVLVPTGHYDDAVAWIDAHHLRARLVYYRVSERRVRETPRGDPGGTVLADLLEVADGPFHRWLVDELEQRASHVCADSVEQFRRERRAVTRTGQVKSPDGRHEKDDRHRVDDRTRWVLGWSNESKVSAVLEQASALGDRLQRLDEELRTLDTARDRAKTRQEALLRLTVRTDWEQLDWRSSVGAISRWVEEKRQLESSSVELADLTRRLAGVEAGLAEAQADREGAADRAARAEQQLEDTADRGARQRRVLDGAADLDAHRLAYPALGALVGELPPEEDDCEQALQDAQRAVDATIEALRSEQQRTEVRAVRAMADFRGRYPEETTEMDDSVLAAEDYRALRDRLVTDDLPRFETEFKRQLNTNTINDLAGFYAWLRRSADQIHERIGTINGSLRDIEYNEGRYIVLEAQRTPNVEIREFGQELRACTEDAADESDHYSESRFLAVKRLLERFRGREGSSDADRLWTQRVTDVRNWFTFAASERWRETDEEYEHYTDSDGKSGGQKEKLAYTILAASLAYQFKLEWGAVRSRDFRFVVIDEAFGRGSDSSTRYALALFRRLGLQLLIVTPLQKVHVIEPYVAGVGFVENRSGERSRVQTLTIEEYTQRQALVRAGRPA